MKKMFFLMLTLMVLGAASMNAQVTIGSDNLPHSGAVLDLQSDNLGLKLPNVALSDTLSIFGLPEEGGFTKENAVGMLVFNTNPTYVAGVYTWTGNSWVALRRGVSYLGEDLIVGGNTYRTFVFPASIGTWMISGSKEGTPDETTFPGQAEGVRGYYYSFENAQNACPPNFSLPSREVTYRLGQYLLHVAGSLPIETWSDIKSMGGIFREDRYPLYWGQRRQFWTADGSTAFTTRFDNRIYIADPGFLGLNQVLCVKD
jgi:hypothetical protein